MWKDRVLGSERGITPDMLFADDMVLLRETVEEVQEKLERWTVVIEKKGLIISRSKTEYMAPFHQQGVAKLEGESLT